MRVSFEIDDSKLFDSEVIRLIDSKIKSKVREQIDKQAQQYIENYIEPRIVNRINNFFNNNNSVERLIKYYIEDKLNDLKYDKIIYDNIESNSKKINDMHDNKLKEINKELKKFYNKIETYINQIPEEKVQKWFEFYLNKKLSEMFNKK